MSEKSGQYELEPQTEQPQILQENLSTPTLPRRIPHQRFWLPLLLQLVLILSVPAQAVHTYITGKTVILQTMPVDPYDLLRGYSQTLSYDISTLETLGSLPGWQEVASKGAYPERGTQLYVVLEQPSNSAQTSPPQAWKPVRVSAQLPQSLEANQIVIQGVSEGWAIRYGVERYYMPEDQREQVNANIQETQTRTPEAFVVEAKVNAQGKAIPLSLWVRDRNYTF
ncbi:MAG: GDYXXLXY domain-containing protein [Microcoleaceae cyanobacterium]